MNRRDFLRTGIGLAAGTAIGEPQAARQAIKAVDRASPPALLKLAPRVCGHSTPPARSGSAPRAIPARCSTRRCVDSSLPECLPPSC